MEVLASTASFNKLQQRIQLHAYLYMITLVRVHTPQTYMSSSILFVFSLFILLTSSSPADGEFSRTVPVKRKLTREKMSHLRFYFHDTVSGRNPSSVPVVVPSPAAHSGTKFGMVWMMDDPLTEGPEPTSREVGRAQGVYASADKRELGLLLVMNMAFTAGKYNGSVLSIMGRNEVFRPVREMPVVGGSGLFRFARGYAQAHTVWFDLKTLDAIVEYNVHVVHY